MRRVIHQLRLSCWLKYQAMNRLSAVQEMGRMTRKTCTKPVITEELFPSSLHVEEQGCAKGRHSFNAMKQSKRVSDWDEASGNTGAGIPEGHWWR